MRKQHPVEVITALVYQPAWNISYRSANVYSVRSSSGSETDQINRQSRPEPPSSLPLYLPVYTADNILLAFFICVSVTPTDCSEVVIKLRIMSISAHLKQSSGSRSHYTTVVINFKVACLP